MRSNSRIILILGLGDDRETDIVQAMTNEHDTLWLEAPFGSSFDLAFSAPCTPPEEAHTYVAGAPAVQPLRIEDIGALQRTADAIAARHGYLDTLVLGSRARFDAAGDDLPWQRLAQPYRFDWLAPIVTCLPLLMRSTAAQIVDLGSPAFDADLRPLLCGTAIRLERVSLATESRGKDGGALAQPAAREDCSLTTL